MTKGESSAKIIKRCEKKIKELQYQKGLPKYSAKRYQDDINAQIEQYRQSIRILQGSE